MLGELPERSLSPLAGMALVKLFVDQWGATVEEYDVDFTSGAVSVDVTVDRTSLRLMRIDRNEIIVRRNRAMYVRAREHVDVVKRFLQGYGTPSAA